MSGSDNPYNASFGNQMTASTSFGAAPAPAAAAGSYITETTTANFAKDVIEESRKQPVLVDFWAPWCGPCKQLTPVLEKVINEAKGRVRLVKMNIDDHPSIAGQLGIQSIPAVIAFVNGRPADGFMGAVPESQIQQFIDRIAGPAGADEAAEIEAVLAEAAELLAAGNINEAAQLYGAVMQADPENAKALAGMAECMIAANQHQRAREILTELPEELAKDAGIQAVLMKLEQIEEARKLGDPVALERELAANPDDHEARIKLAKIRNVEGRRDEAADHLLLIMRKDRAFDDDGARRQLLQFFEVWGFKDPATVAARRKLSAMLFS
ncbi:MULTISPECIES: thioredoxin [Rhizobium]|uniref:thioredoxin n=1 Tax=Rhizobium TaxID=379 RepID=UPI0014426ABA|nr:MULTISPECIES: thioredoxin [Rhizobium]MBY3051746.1 thioredoxin [Rhizobium laguerreae]MBY3209621.1 thioredoxin [Rhizobium laguerreae]NKL04759.1 thioredoxin [Rhizobium leguminosarum bv. viciae]NKL85399.1 thioredoxin [Rhizobium leguminosarum bv. viciae]NKL90821.1 thioredoxin [Rhizobium leguminosarum bv. viciae]